MANSNSIVTISTLAQANSNAIVTYQSLNINNSTAISGLLVDVSNAASGLLVATSNAVAGLLVVTSNAAAGLLVATSDATNATAIKALALDMIDTGPSHLHFNAASITMSYNVLLSTDHSEIDLLHRANSLPRTAAPDNSILPTGCNRWSI